VGAGRPAERTLALGIRDGGSDGCRHRAGDLILDGEHVGRRAPRLLNGAAVEQE
jgi:hypothetical protein